MRLAGIRAERKDIFRELRGRKLGRETARKLIRELPCSKRGCWGERQAHREVPGTTMPASTTLP